MSLLTMTAIDITSKRVRLTTKPFVILRPGQARCQHLGPDNRYDRQGCYTPFNPFAPFGKVMSRCLTHVDRALEKRVGLEEPVGPVKYCAAVGGHLRPLWHEWQCPPLYTLTCHREVHMSNAAVPPSAVRVVLGEEELFAYPRKFSSGSVGWHLSTKLEVEGERCQVSLSIVVIGTKPKTGQTEETGEEGSPPPPPPPTMPPEANGRVKRPKAPKKCPDAV